MKPFHRLRSQLVSFEAWLHALLHRNRLEAEMEAEFADHLERHIADLIASGLTPAQAARQARIEFGNAITHKEQMRAVLGLRVWDELRADLRFAFRLLSKSPAFTATAALSLSLAIGANTAILSLAKSVLYDRLAVPQPQELRLLRWTGDNKVLAHSLWGDFDSSPGGGTTSTSFPFPVYRVLCQNPKGKVELAAFKENSMNATVRGVARQANVAMVSGSFYSTLKVQPQIGRAIQPSDDTDSANSSAAVLSDALWDKEFGRSPAAIGQTVTVNQMQLVIVGVNPKGFTGAKNTLESPDLFVSIALEPRLTTQRSHQTDLENPDFWWVNVVGRVREGAKPVEAEASLNVQFQAALHALAKHGAGDSFPTLELADGSRGLHFEDRIYGKPLTILLALTGFVLLLACANVANLLLSRGAQRQREMSVRLALGANRARVARQLLTESLLLAAIGGAGGLALGYFCRNLLPRLMANSWDQSTVRVSFDWGVFACTSAVVLLCGVLFGLAPAWFAARTEVSASLKESAQTATRRRRGLSGKALIGLQIALSTLLVVGAGLFLRTLTALQSIDVGFDTRNLVLFDINPPPARYPEGLDLALHRELERRFAAMPGVEGVAPSYLAYLADNNANADFLVEGEVYDRNKQQAEDFNAVGNAFFHTMGISILAGRAFGEQDSASAPKVAIVNAALARKRFPNTDPIGKTFRMGSEATDEPIHIVGICADTYYSELRDQPPPQFFVPYAQQKLLGGMTYALRTSLPLSSLEPMLERTVQAVDRDLPVTDLRTQRQQIDALLQVERMLAALTSGFGLLALALACVGIYGVMAYSVAQRTNEIGIRLALGAQPSQVRRMILLESVRTASAGIVLGSAAALALARLVRSMLYGVQPWDPGTVGAGVGLLLAVALASAWIPASRAARVQPMQALRHE